MLLSFAGVDRDAIVGDYDAAFRTANALMADDPTHHRRYARSPEELDDWMIQRTAAMHDWLAVLDVGAYLRSAGLPEQTIERLRTLLV